MTGMQPERSKLPQSRRLRQFTKDPQGPLTILQRSWLRLALTWLVLWVIGYRLLSAEWPYAQRWLLLSGITLAYCLWLLWRFLPENQRVGETSVLPRLGLGNRLTLLRGLGIGLLAGFLFSPWPQGGLAWIIALLYTAVSIVDYFDGYVARKTNHATVLGSRLDMEFDGLGVLVVSLLAVWYGQLPWWFLSIGVARYLFVWGLWWRGRRGLPIFDIPPSIQRRILAGVQMGLLTVVLWPILPAPMATLAGTLVAVPTLIGFGRDYAIAAGWLDPANVPYNQIRHFLAVLLMRWLPPVWRLLLPVCMLLILQAADMWWRPTAWQALLLSWGLSGLPTTAVLTTLLSLTAIICALLVLVGFAGRLTAVPLLFPIGFDIATRGLTTANGLALTAVMFVVLFGCGPWALWSPEDRLFLYRGAADTSGDDGIRAS